MLVTTILDITKLLPILLVWLHLASASPILGHKSIEARQFPCAKGQSFGCLPLGRSWNSFDLAVPNVGDPLTHHAQSPGAEVRAEVWTRGDGGAMLAVRLVEGWEPTSPDSQVDVQATIDGTQISLSSNRFHYFFDAGIGTVPASLLEPARKKANPVIIKIQWRTS